MLTSVGVIVGWYLHWRILVQPLSQTILMQFTTAVCFILLAGSSWLFVSKRGHHLLPVIGSALVVLMSGLTLIQYIAGISLGIDTLLFSPWTIAPIQHPGRMMPLTA